MKSIVLVEILNRWWCYLSFISPTIANKETEIK
ncbi:hypothetical protein TNIN_287421, partial [Trichonephila inaurata madagascariensis]